MKTQYIIYSYTEACKIMIGVLMLSVFSLPFKICAQTNVVTDEVIPIKFGDPIPEQLWNIPLQIVNDPSGKKVMTLEQYKGKLILLDFWGTFCSACIQAFPKLKKIQENNLDKLKILSVSEETGEKVQKFFNSALGKQYTYVHSVVEDSILYQYFPHRGLPHVIWITPDGKYLNPTGSYEVTQDNIDGVLNNKQQKLNVKIDMDRKRPLFLSDNFFINDNMKLGFYSVFTQGYYPGLPTGNNFKKNAVKKVYGRQLTNQKLNAILKVVASQLFNERREDFSEKRIIFNTTNSMLQDRENSFSDQLPNDQYYSYALFVPENQADSLYTYMLQDLNRYLDFKLSLEKRYTDCLVLVRTSAEDKIKTKGGKEKKEYAEVQSDYILQNVSLSNLLSLFNELPLSKLPIIDDTGYLANVDIKLSGIKSLSRLQSELAGYDLVIKEAKKDLWMFVINDKWCR